MPITTPEIKIKDVKRFGAKIIQHGDDVNTALQEAKSLSNKKKEMQLSFISPEDPLGEELKQEISKIDIDNLKPLEALLILNKLKKKLGKG